MEITDEMVKKKHKEFNARVSAALNRKGSNTSQFSPEIERLRRLAQLRKPTLERPFGQ